MKAALRYARPVLVIALVAACVWALIASWDDVTEVLPRVGVTRFVLSTLAVVASGIALAVGWRILLSDIADEQLGHRESVAVYSASQLGKYVPGSVWPVVAQMSLARRHGIMRRSIVVAFLLQLVLLLVAAVVVAALTLPFVDAAELRQRWWLLLCAPAACLILVPSVQRRVLAAVGRLLKRDLTMRLPSGRAVAWSMLASIVTFVCFGVHLALFAWPLSTAPAEHVLLQSTGAFALGWGAGAVVIFAPAGLGVREVILKVTMGSVLTSADATAVAVLSRTAIVLADLLLGVIGIAFVVVVRRRMAQLDAARNAADEALNDFGAAEYGAPTVDSTPSG